MIIIFFFVGHWFLSLFFQTFFQHRYASHRMFTTTPFWERTFYLMAYVFQGSSFLSPRAYALMHRAHHAYSDTEKDPHSPHFFTNVFQLMKATAITFRDYLKRTRNPETKFEGYYPEWPLLDRIDSSIPSRLLFGVLYTCFYFVFAAHWWLFLLLPIHFLMGPLHGAIVNWCGHKYGYQNYNNNDKSKNATPFDFLMLGELFQNNHHRHPNSANFGKKWFEVDPVYPIMRGMHWLGVIKLRKKH